MAITATTLSRSAGGAVAGLIFISIQINHPPLPPATSVCCSPQSMPRASPFWPAASSSASRCTGHASWPAGLPRFSPSAASSPLSEMPDTFFRLLAFPNGIAMIALGYSLWRHHPHRDHGDACRRPRPALNHGWCRMTASIVLGLTAIRRRDIAAHRAWMIRAYAPAVGAGTQVFTQGIGEAHFGTSELSTALSVSSGWVINAAVAEWVIRRPDARRSRRARLRTALAGSQ